jgi:hypothetical protein
MDKETKQEIATYLHALAKLEHWQGMNERTQGAASLAAAILPLLTERANSDRYKTALRNLRFRARNCREITEAK